VAVAIAAGFTLASVWAGAALGAKGDTVLISRQSTADGGAGADGSSSVPSISSNGRYVAFDSGADNLSGADDDDVGNVFVRDTVNNTIELVSRQSASAGGAGGDDGSRQPWISSNGRYVAFESNADNLSGVDDDDENDIFVRDTVNNTTKLVSRQTASAGGAGGDGFSDDPSISSDGRYVAFDSNADNLNGSDDNNSVENVFVRDTVNKTTKLVSRQSASAGGAGADDGSQDSSISPNGRYVAFESNADNLSGVDDDGVVNVFVRDTVNKTTELVSRQSASAGGAGGDGGARDPSISSSGRYVAFSSDADNLSGADDNSIQNVFVRDRTDQTTRLVSRRTQDDDVAGAGAGGDADSRLASISSSGRYVAFRSDADNLSQIDDDSFANIFWRDTVENLTRLVSRQDAEEGSAGADEDSFDPRISGDGRFVAFGSRADNLVTGEDESFDNAFRRQVLP
jgi:Tol biopolymer transport system component